MKIAIIGAGNMGLAFSSSFVKNQIAEQQDIHLVEPRLEVHQQLLVLGYSWISPSVTEEITKCSLIILAVKPQDFGILAQQLTQFLKSEQILLSIMAGVSIEKITSLTGLKKIVRCMPNTPAKLGVGITGYYLQHLQQEEAAFIQRLLESTGKAVQLSQESFLNAVTAISGSGPAYFYYFLRAMVQAGKDLGLPEEMAKELASETMLGAYHLVANSTDSFDALIKAVASKGGTTEAALQTFELHGVGESISRGVINAESRAWELSQM